MGRRLLITGLIVAIATTSASGFAVNQSGLLWRVVQTCLVSHRLTGSPFPCLQVDTSKGRDSGYAVIRAPLEDTHIIVSPTVRTIGIEADRLRGDAAPNYFQDAWAARHFVIAPLDRKPARDDLALAVNSRPGRSQDQLHIHVDCIKPEVKRLLDRQKSALKTDGWTRVQVMPETTRFFGRALAQADLANTNLFDLTAEGLKVSEADMHDLTIVVLAMDFDGRPGFVVLARKRKPNSGDIAHGEALLDHRCAAFR